MGLVALQTFIYTLSANNPMGDIIKTRMRFKGEFDYHGLITLMKNYFLSREYDFYEKRYKDKGKEAEVDWVAEREYDEYNIVGFKITWHMWDYTKFDKEVNGKTKTYVKARIYLQITSFMERNWGPVKIYNEKSKFDRFLKGLHERITYRELDETWEGIALGMQHDLMAKIKAHIGMQSQNE
jgi:hypothetical protein